MGLFFPQVLDKLLNKMTIFWKGYKVYNLYHQESTLGSTNLYNTTFRLLLVNKLLAVNIFTANERKQSKG